MRDESLASTRPSSPMLVIGMTGGIGSGKSAVADAFAQHGVAITDTDRLAHTLTAPGKAGHTAIAQAFGQRMLLPDGTIDRAKLRETVFADPSARARLEAILHPLIGAAAKAEVSAWPGPYGILVVPLLLERGGLAGIVDRVLVVDCPEGEQIRRVVARSGLDARAVEAIMAAQTGRRERLARADEVIDNSGSPEAIAPQVAVLDAKYRMLAAEKSGATP